MSDSIYVDACAIIAWIKVEFPPYQKALEQLIIDSKSGAQQIIISSIMHEEVSEGETKDKYKSLVRAFYNSKKLRLAPLTSKILREARKIQEEGNELLRLNPTSGKNKIGKFDSIHIATAMMERVDALYTFDEAMIKLSGREFISGLIIKKPDKVIRTK